MIFKATRLIEEEFRKRGVKFRVEEPGDMSAVAAGFSIQNGPNAVVHFISRDNDNDVAVRLTGLLGNIAQEKRPAMLTAINECNKTYRYIKFTMDGDGDLGAEYDIPQSINDALVGELALEMFARFMKICQDAYPTLMRAAWM